MRLIPVADPDDPRLRPYRDVRDRDLSGRHDAFMAEGEVVLRALIRTAPERVASAFLAEKRVEGLADALAALPPDTPVYAVPQGVMDLVAGFPLHRGVLALGRRGPPVAAQALLSGLGPRALVAVAVGIGNHDNMGGLFRNAAAFGAAAVLLDPGSCDPLYRKAIRVSVGAALSVPFARLSPGEDLAGLLAAYGFQTLALTPSGEVDLAATPRAPRVAALFGAEGPGLPAALMDRALKVRIPMAAGFDSLNVATASGVVLHHLSRVARPCA